MPVPAEMKPFFDRLVEKSKKSEINWEAAGQPSTYQVRFPDFAIAIAQDDGNPNVEVRLHNDRGEPTTVITVTDADDDWLRAVSLINSADRKVRRVSQTLRRAMEELARDGEIGLDSEGS